jgi:D-alanyl-D-alanine carboxypeptidase (penicillin-binding protein 5/6)
MPAKSLARLILAGLLVLGALAARAAPSPLPAPPDVKAEVFFLVDFQSGKTLAEKNADQRAEPASITKVMTAYVIFREIANGKVALEDEVSISENAWRKSMGTSRTFLEPRTRVSVETLLQGMIIQSGNDASIALAEHIAGTEETFALMMNAYATELGMTGTNFMNTTGLPDDNHYTTARDLAILAAALVREFPDFYRWYSVPEFTYNEITQPNRNKLLRRDPSADGIKTGWTESADYCLLSSAIRDGRRLISVVLKSPTEKLRTSASEALINYGFRFYETHRLYGAGDPIETARVWKGDRETVGLGLEQDLYVTVPRGRYPDLQAFMDVTPQLIAPLESARPVGRVTVSLDEEIIDSRDLFPLATVPEGSLWQQASDSVLLWFE